MKNEKGYALILVLMIITIVMILGMALSGTVINTSKQFNKTDNRNKATDLAEMGVTYYQSLSNSLIGTAQTTAINSNTSFCTEITKLLNDNTENYYKPQTVEGQNVYQVTFVSISTCTPNMNSISVVFNSKGITATNEQAQVTGTLTFSKQSRAGQPVPNFSSFTNGLIGTLYTSSSNIYYGDVTINGNGRYTLNNTSWFNTLVLKGNSTITINNLSIFNTISMNGITNITVNGDAIFFRNQPQKFVGKASICITGNIYTVNNNQIADFTDFSNYFTNTCSNTYSTWYIDPNNGVSVTYN